MNSLLCFAFFAAALFVQSYECKLQEPQIKMVGYDKFWFNKKYSEQLEYAVTPHNATYNNMQVHWKIIKDLPIDTTVFSQVYVTDENFQNPRLILNVAIPMCFEHENRLSLPKIAVFPESQLNSVCFPKGTYDTEDMGNLRFEWLLPNVQELGKHYIVRYILHNAYEDILNVNFYCKWGYLN